MAYEPEVFRATVVGIKSRDGVVVATDKRLSYGGLILSKNAKRIFTIHNRLIIAFAGLYGDAGGLLRYLESDLKIYEMITSGTINARTVAKRLSTIMYSYKFFPFMIETIVAGVGERPEMYVLDPLGSIIEEDYVAIGTGATTAFGVLERGYASDMDIEEAERLAVSAVKAAISRDVGSGDGIDVAAVTKGGISERSIALKIVEG